MAALAYFCYCQNPVHEREYIDLFHLLPPKDKEWLTKKWAEKYNEDLEQKFGTENDTFVEWRYGYEKEKLESALSFLKNLAELLKERAE